MIRLLIFSLVLLTACKQNTDTTAADSSSSEVRVPAASSATDPHAGHDHGADELNPWTFMTACPFELYARVIGGKLEEKKESSFLTLSEDYTYSLREGNETVEIGRYNYDHDTKIMEMINESPVGQNREYTVLFNNSSIVLVGTTKYGNNAEQSKWKRTPCR